MAMRLTLLSLLSSALGWKYTSIAVPGSQVKEAGNLTMGGKIGTYTVLLQVLNPGAGDLVALIECCGDAQPLAGEISARINTNEFEGIGDKPIMQHIQDKFVGEGKCSVTGPLQAMLQQGQEQCQYLYAFANKAWKEYQYMSYCVPEDVCAIDVVGATKGTKVGYNVVIQILNPIAGDLIYAGEGPVSDCLAGSNMVNSANTTTFKTEETKYIDVFGHKLPAGKETQFHVPGMKQQGLLNMIGKCKDTAETGMLYVYKNKIWSDSYSSMNVSRFLDKQAAAQAKKEAPAAASPEPAAPAAPAPSLKVPDVGALVAALKPKLQQEEKAGVDPEEDTKGTQALLNKAEDKVEDEATDAAPAVPPAPEAPKVELPKIELPKVDLGAELKKKGDEAEDTLAEAAPPAAPAAPAAPGVPAVKPLKVPKLNLPEDDLSELQKQSDEAAGLTAPAAPALPATLPKLEMKMPKVDLPKADLEELQKQSDKAAAKESVAPAPAVAKAPPAPEPPKFHVPQADLAELQKSGDAVAAAPAAPAPAEAVAETPTAPEAPPAPPAPPAPEAPEPATYTADTAADQAAADATAQKNVADAAEAAEALAAAGGDTVTVESRRLAAIMI